jgi:hypothetical protein
MVNCLPAAQAVAFTLLSFTLYYASPPITPNVSTTTAFALLSFTLYYAAQAGRSAGGARVAFALLSFTLCYVEIGGAVGRDDMRCIHSSFIYSLLPPWAENKARPLGSCCIRSLSVLRCIRSLFVYSLLHAYPVDAPESFVAVFMISLACFKQLRQM